MNNLRELRNKEILLHHWQVALDKMDVSDQCYAAAVKDVSDLQAEITKLELELGITEVSTVKAGC